MPPNENGWANTPARMDIFRKRSSGRVSTAKSVAVPLLFQLLADVQVEVGIDSSNRGSPFPQWGRRNTVPGRADR